MGREHTSSSRMGLWFMGYTEEGETRNCPGPSAQIWERQKKHPPSHGIPGLPTSGTLRNLVRACVSQGQRGGFGATAQPLLCPGFQGFTGLLNCLSAQSKNLQKPAGLGFPYGEWCGGMCSLASKSQLCLPAAPGFPRRPSASEHMDSSLLK